VKILLLLFYLSACLLHAVEQSELILWQACHNLASKELTNKNWYLKLHAHISLEYFIWQVQCMHIAHVMLATHRAYFIAYTMCKWQIAEIVNLKALIYKQEKNKCTKQCFCIHAITVFMLEWLLSTFMSSDGIQLVCKNLLLEFL